MDVDGHGYIEGRPEMSVQIYPWERQLLDKACEALKSPIVSQPAHRVDCDRLEIAYRHCEELTRIGSRTFFFAANLLSREKRRAIQALYAFCRITDDLVDNPKVSNPAQRKPIECGHHEYDNYLA